MRKNNPELTIEKILSVSAKLFIERGYDKTSIQDIIKELGMSKGAIYHHFKSKEEVLEAILLKHSKAFEQTLEKWIHDNKTCTAREKLIIILDNNWSYNEKNSLNKILVSKSKNPQLIVGGMETSVNKSAPILAKIMSEGKQDGSITTDFPQECAQVFFLLINIWCDPMTLGCNLEELVKRLKFLQQMMQRMGADIITDELIEKIQNFFKEFL